MADAIESLRPALLRTLETLGLSSSPTTTDALLSYLTLLQRWNATYNLTAVREPRDMLTQHLADCLTVIPHLLPALASRTAARLLDVGSGGGLPGAVIAIMVPAVQVTCVDAVGKKAAFVQQVAAVLKLPNLMSKHARVEQLEPTPFDLVTSRAFASLADFVSLTRPRLKEDGVWLAMKGKTPAEEIADLPADVDMFHVEQLVVPGLDADRCLVWMRQIAERRSTHSL